MLLRTLDFPARSRAVLSLAINTALALGWHAAGATAPPVVNCNSSGTGSLAAAIADPMTVDGDTIDLTPLKHVCSKITVADLAVHQNNLVIQGSGAKYLTLDGGNTDRLLDHDGNGTLALSGVTLANGSFTSNAEAKGGCVYSAGNVSLIDVDVSHCAVHGTAAPNNAAVGGALYTKGHLHLLRSTISDSHATGDAGVSAIAGGAYAKNGFTALYSTMTDNSAETASNAFYSLGGALTTPGDVDIQNSTISANRADIGGGLRLIGGNSHTASIVNSTISGNTGTVSVAGIWNSTALTIANSTIAFNHSLLGTGSKGAGLYSLNPLTLTSTIVAGNSGQDGPNDLAGGAMATVAGSDNLIFKTSMMLPMSNNTTGVCPKLDVLADNGGPTFTHGLKTMSEAIDHGSAAMTLALDQRLQPRVTGSQADIGAVEWKATDKPEGFLRSGFDGLCDQ